MKKVSLLFNEAALAEMKPFMGVKSLTEFTRDALATQVQIYRLVRQGYRIYAEAPDGKGKELKFN